MYKADYPRLKVTVEKGNSYDTGNDKELEHGSDSGRYDHSIICAAEYAGAGGGREVFRHTGFISAEDLSKVFK